MKMKIPALFLCLICAVSTLAQGVTADLVIVNANIHTMDPKNPSAQSIAVWQNKIIAVGKDADTKVLIGPKTRVIDAQGKLVIPGFNDAHVHFTETGGQLSSVNLRDSRAPEEFARDLRDFAAKVPKGRWITGGRWDHENWKPANLPTRQLIDSVTAANPVFISRLDGHMALANSEAMRLAGVTRDTKDVEGGVIVRDANGEPTGIFKDAAMDLIRKVIPDASFEQKIEMAQAATDHAASLGVTSVQDMSAGTNAGVYQELLRRGTLKTRVYGCSPLGDFGRWEKTGLHYAFGDPMLRVGCLKGYSDGSLGSTTAWFFKPYMDAPETSGLAREDMAVMLKNVTDADKAGLQIMIHAIGDRANAEVLDMFQKLSQVNGTRDRRPRIEHSQHLRLEDIKRFGAQKVVASMQPVHLPDDGRWAGKRLDPDRLKGTYAFRALLDSGAVLAFGSDSPVAPLNPLFGVWGAVTRQTADGANQGGWIPEQKITVDEAVRAFTWGSAYAEFQENWKGTLTTGKLADIIILSDDIFTIDPVKIPQVRVLTTIADGRVVFEAK